MTPSDAFRPGLAAALKARLAALGGPVATCAPSLQPTAAADEALRRLMVPLRTRLRRRSLDDAGAAALAEALQQVAGRADWSDIRFLDALNLIHEDWDVTYLPQHRAAFLELYRAVLQRAVS